MVEISNAMRIKEMPKEERPTERLLQEGASHLSNAELLAIILRTGTKKESALQIAQRLLIQYGGLHRLREMSIQEITKLPGIGVTKAVQLLAVIELGKRLNQVQNNGRYTIRSPKDCADYLWDDMRHLMQEHFLALYLNTKNQIIHKQTLFIGSLNSSIVHPREVFKEAIKRSAASIICAHNHPSGDPTPSREDIDVTKRLVECGKLMGIELLDHIILGEQKFVSLKEKGYV